MCNNDIELKSRSSLRSEHRGSIGHRSEQRDSIGHRSEYRDSAGHRSEHRDSIGHENEKPKVSRVRRLSHTLFHKNELDRVLERPHIAGKQVFSILWSRQKLILFPKAIAFSGTVGMGIFVTSGELIGISGSLGCVISYICAGLIIIPVMRCLAEMVSVRPVSGALMDYPHIFVDEALGFAVGVTYWSVIFMSKIILTSVSLTSPFIQAS